MDKKALFGFKNINLILNFIFLAVVVFIMVLFFNSFFTVSFDTSDAEAEIMASRILFSPNGFTYCDKACHPGIIDYDIASNATMMNERFSKALNYTARKTPILVFNSNLSDSTGQKISSTYFPSEDEYQKFISLSSYPQFKHVQKSYYVLYHQGNSLKPGTLAIDMVIEVE